jgi:hypothetical protein
MITPAMAAEKNPPDKPQFWLGPEVEIKSETKAESDKKEKGWLAKNKLWVALDAILAGGTVVAPAAGGSSNDNSSSDGTFSMDW